MAVTAAQLLCTLGLLIWLPTAPAASNKIPIGGLFYPDDVDHLQTAFYYGVERVNRDFRLLPHSILVGIPVNVSQFDSFMMGKKVCNLTRDGVAALFGPQSSSTAPIVRSISEAMELPNLQTRWEANGETMGSRSGINLHPDPAVLARALVDVVKFLQWRSFTIIYETDDGLMKLQEVLKAHNPSDLPVTVRQLQAGSEHRPLLKEIQVSGETHVILECSTDKILEVLRQAKDVKMMGDYQSYFITSLDTHTVDLSEFRYGQTNITSLRLIDPSSPEVQDAVDYWVEREKREGKLLNLTPQTVRTETALMYDAVHLFATAVHKHNQTLRLQPISCDNVQPWHEGFDLRNYLKLMRHHGMSGNIEFDDDGRRSYFKLDLVETYRNGFRKMGTWEPETGITGTQNYTEILTEIGESLQNKTFIVSSRIGKPFLNWKLPKEGREGNDRFEGYSLDLIDEIATRLKFKYKFELVPDEGYGSFKDGKWNGLVKELLDRKADLALCDLTITYDRERAVDFTMPFMNLGISILYSKPVKPAPRLFSFLEPLSFDVWIYMATAYLGVSVLLFALARITPHQWDNPHPCNPEPEELENQFNLLNCMWFAIGSLMAQGCDFLPKAISTRMLAAMWWFFTLIMISSYTANLAAFLTVTRMEDSISSVEDLAKQTKIKYGGVRGGSTSSFFEKSNYSTYQRMWTVMQQTRPEVFAKNNDEGVDRVKKGKGSYAFFMESTSIEYVVERNCDLQQIGGMLDSKGYGIAMPVDSPYRTLISGAVLQLQETGVLDRLKKRWWKERGGGACDADKANDKAADSNELGLANVGGVFVVLIGGCCSAFLISVLELLWNCRKIAVEEKMSPWEALKMELRFALKCSISTKPVHRQPSEPDENLGGSSVQLDFDRQYK